MRRARESIFWPRIATELKVYVSKCDVCLTHRISPQKETLISHEFVPRPWAKVGADLCELQGRTLLVVTDYFSNYIEVESEQTTTTKAIIKVLMTLFARYGVPSTLVTDNGPQFPATEMKAFSKAWGFDHVTSSPHYPQSNGKAENAVKTVKRLFKKCQEAGQSALLDWGFDHVTSSPHYPQSNGKAENAVKTVKRLFNKCQEVSSELCWTGETHRQRAWVQVQHSVSWGAAARPSCH